MKANQTSIAGAGSGARVRRIRVADGKSEFKIVVVIAVILTLSVVVVLFQLFKQSEDHVDKVKKTKVSYIGSAEWAPSDNDCDAAIAKALQMGRSRVEFRVDNCNVTSRGTAMIAQMTQLKKLELTQSNVEPGSLKKIVELPLEELDLYGSDINDQELANVAKIKSLGTLKLGATDITDSGMKMLCDLPHLQRVSVNTTKVTNDGIRQIAENKQLRGIYFQDCMADRECFKYLYPLPLEELEAGKVIVNAADIKPLSKSMRLFGLGHCNIGDEELEAIAQFPKLTALHLDNNPFTDRGLAKLERLKSLAYLNISSCKNVTPKAVAHFKKAHPTLQLVMEESSSMDALLKE